MHVEVVWDNGLDISRGSVDYIWFHRVVYDEGLFLATKWNFKRSFEMKYWDICSPSLLCSIFILLDFILSLPNLQIYIILFPIICNPTYTHVCMHICIYTNMYICINVYRHDLYVYKHKYKCVCVYI